MKEHNDTIGYPLEYGASYQNQNPIDTTKKTKDWALVQNAALAGGVKVELGLFR